MQKNKIGRYEIVSQIGRGGMARVFLAYDPLMDRQVALKQLPANLLDNEKLMQRFIREAKMVASLEHAAIVPVYDYGEDENQPYFVMRLMQGGSLQDCLQKKKFGIEESLKIIIQLCAGLQKAHSAGIIHRDIKPANIMFDADGNPCLADFGIAKLSEKTAALTGSGIIGTPAYMSPEQALAQPNIDGRSDIYSLAAVLFTMLSGRHPYEADTPIGVALAHINEPVPQISKFRKDVPKPVEQVIAKAMAKRPSDRYQSAKEFASELEMVLFILNNADQMGMSSEFSISGNETLLEDAGNQPDEKKRLSPTFWTCGIAAMVVFIGLFIGIVILMQSPLFYNQVVSVFGFATSTNTPGPTKTITETFLPSTAYTQTINPTETLTYTPSHTITQEIPTSTVTSTSSPTDTEMPYVYWELVYDPDMWESSWDGYQDTLISKTETNCVFEYTWPKELPFDWKNTFQSSFGGINWDVTTYYRNGEIILEQYLPDIERDDYNTYEIHMKDYSEVSDSCRQSARDLLVSIR